uniref:Uncharacterized protein n=1 Tax=Cacopsylla melanoneura TaxID=428564 RepID=A0A8D8R0S4_9HEMI
MVIKIRKEKKIKKQPTRKREVIETEMLITVTEATAAETVIKVADLVNGHPTVTTVVETEIMAGAGDEKAKTLGTQGMITVVDTVEHLLPEYRIQDTLDLSQTLNQAKRTDIMTKYVARDALRKDGKKEMMHGMENVIDMVTERKEIAIMNQEDQESILVEVVVVEVTTVPPTNHLGKEDAMITMVALLKITSQETRRNPVKRKKQRLKMTRRKRKLLLQSLWVTNLHGITRQRKIGKVTARKVWMMTSISGVAVILLREVLEEHDHHTLHLHERMTSSQRKDP